MRMQNDAKRSLGLQQRLGSNPERPGPCDLAIAWPHLFDLAASLAMEFDGASGCSARVSTGVHQMGSGLSHSGGHLR